MPSIIIVTGSCCMPGMAPLDQQARDLVAQAVRETGVQATVKEVSASSAAFGALPRKLVAEFMSVVGQEGRVPLPAVLVDGRPVAPGLPELTALKAALADTNHKEGQIDG
ncbi:MAG TPA: hypothetical protein VNT75_19650 [Symbiobacteriaceae bacterium]|nr:hypothetical protein [Symbiobacteriaceae bacterium]